MKLRLETWDTEPMLRQRTPTVFQSWRGIWLCCFEFRKFRHQTPSRGVVTSADFVWYFSSAHPIKFWDMQRGHFLPDTYISSFMVCHSTVGITRGVECRELKNPSNDTHWYRGFWWQLCTCVRGLFPGRSVWGPSSSYLVWNADYIHARKASRTWSWPLG